MPTVLRVDGFEMVIYLHDHLPPHVHVFAGESEAIINLHCGTSEPEIREVFRCKKREVKKALHLVTSHRVLLCAMWKEIHGNL